MLATIMLPSLAVITGFFILIWGAGRFVVGAANLAFNSGASPLLIGLTIVGLGTSAPEMIVSTVSALQGKSGMGIGNAIGSNITNIALVAGFTAIIFPITVKAGIISRELPLLMIVNLVVILLLWDQQLSRLDGILLLSGLVLVLIWMVRNSRQQPPDATELEIDHKLTQRMSTGKAILLTVFGLLILIGSSRLVVWGAVGIANYFGVSDLIIGLTLIAVGTSLPELAASIMAATKRQHELVLGNIIGSNIFNLLGVLAFPGIIAPGILQPEVLSRDVPVMTLLTLALFATAYSFASGKGQINRLEGCCLLGAFIAYITHLYLGL